MNGSIVDSLAEDLLLLSITDKGYILPRLGYGLMGSELVRLAAAGRIYIEGSVSKTLRIDNRQVLVRDKAPVGDAELDAALDSLVKAKHPPSPTNWIGQRRPSGLRSAYLDRLVSSGAVRRGPRGLLGRRYLIADPARLADARARLDAIALSSGQVDVAQAALGGLAHAIGIPGRFYPRPVLTRMQQIVDGQLTVEAAPAAAAGDAATEASFRAVVPVAIAAVIAVATASERS